MPIMVLSREKWKGRNLDHDIRPVDYTTFSEMNRVLSEAFEAEETNYGKKQFLTLPAASNVPAAE